MPNNPETELRICRRCLLLEAGDKENFDLVQEHIKKIRPSEKTPGTNTRNGFLSAETVKNSLTVRVLNADVMWNSEPHF